MRYIPDQSDMHEDVPAWFDRLGTLVQWLLCAGVLAAFAIVLTVIVRALWR